MEKSLPEDPSPPPARRGRGCGVPRGSGPTFLHIHRTYVGGMVALTDFVDFFPSAYFTGGRGEGHRSRND